MAKIVSSSIAFLQTDYNGDVISSSPANAWFGNSFTDMRCNVAGNTITCKPNQKIRVTPMELAFNKGILPVVNSYNNCFFVVDLPGGGAPNTITPVYIALGCNPSCVGTEVAAATQPPNSLCAMINIGLNNAGLGAITVAVRDSVSAPAGGNLEGRSYIGNLVFSGLTATQVIVCVRDTNQINRNGVQLPATQTPYNRSAHRIIGGYLNDIHFNITGAPTSAEIGALLPAYVEQIAGPPATETMPYPPQMVPLGHVYLRSNTLGPNNLEIAVNSTDPSNGLAASNIILRVPYTTGGNLSNAGLGGQNFEQLTGPFAARMPPNAWSAHSNGNSWWRWRNQSGKDFQFFAPSNTISTMQFSLTDTQSVNLINYYTGVGRNYWKNGYGMFITLRFDIIE